MKPIGNTPSRGEPGQQPRGRAQPPPPAAVTDRTQLQEQTRPLWPGRAHRAREAPVAALQSTRRRPSHPQQETPHQPPGAGLGKPDLARPSPDGAQTGPDLGQGCAARAAAEHPAAPAAKGPRRRHPGHPTPPPPPELASPERTARPAPGDPASPASRAGRSMSAARRHRTGLCPAACADGGEGEEREERNLAARGLGCSPDSARGGRSGAKRFFCRMLLHLISIWPTTPLLWILLLGHLPVIELPLGCSFGAVEV
nr:uncharacterized protein LOC127319157 [Lolium perenne]